MYGSSVNNKDEVDDGFRCSGCNKLLAKASDYSGAYEIKCLRCGEINSIFKGFTDQVVVTDPDGVVIYANSIIESITGYGLNEILGNKPSLWGGQMSKKFYEDMWYRIKVEKKPIQVVMTNKKKDGTLYDVKLNISPVFGFNNEIKMFVGIESVIS